MRIAGLYTLVATCEARGINPFAYLADVIPRAQDHPKRRLDELLPGPPLAPPRIQMRVRLLGFPLPLTACAPNHRKQAK